jgi:hypothetical protein
MIAGNAAGLPFSTSLRRIAHTERHRAALGHAGSGILVFPLQWTNTERGILTRGAPKINPRCTVDEHPCLRTWLPLCQERLQPDDRKV